MQIPSHGLSEILDRVSDAVIAVDPRWQIAFVNSTAARLTGKTPDDLIGGVLWADMSIYPTRDGLTIYIRDCSEKRAADEALRLRSAMLGAVGEAVIATDLDGIVLSWNEAAVQLYGWTADEAVGKPIVDLTPSTVSRADAEKIMSILAGGESWQGAFQVQRKDGSSFLAHVTDAPVLGQDGKLIGIVGVSYNRDRASHAPVG